MAIIDLGRVAYLNKKEWQPTATYEIKDVVSYHGSSWASLVNSNLKQTPSEGTFWTLMSKSTYQSWLDQGNIGTEADFITSITQVQSDWSQTNSASNSFIKNKPATFIPSVHKHIKSEITDFPASLPANGGNSDTVSGYTVLSNVPTNAKFTDTVYNDTAVRKLITEESSRATSAEGVLNTEISKKVTAVTGKVLSTEDFTTLLKTKLEGLTNYDDATLSSGLNALKLRLDTLVGTSASSAIDTFNEITAFLAGITDTKNLTTLLSSLRTEIVAIIPTKTSQITNDSNFVVDTNYVHTDNNYSTGEKNKLSTIAANANNYTHPAYTQKVSGLYKITVDNKGHVSDVILVSKGDITALGIPAQDTNTVYSKTTIAADGLMSKEDKKIVDDLANKYVQKEAGKGLFSGNYLDLRNKPYTPTLDHEPLETDLTFTDAEGAHTFLIGDMVRVMDAKKKEYVFFQLYDIAVGKALWKKAGSGGDMQLTEKVNISLSGNQTQPDTSLNGLILHVKYGDNDTPLTWNGTVLTADVPMNITYRIIYPALEGYATPSPAEYVALAGNTRTVEAMYNATLLTISIDSNQTDKADLNNLKINLSGSITKVLTYAGQPLSLKVPTGQEVVISPAQLAGYTNMPSTRKTPTMSIDSAAFAYTTEKVTINVTTDDSASVSAETLTVTKVADGSVIHTGAAGTVVLKIPFGVQYKVSVNAKSGYNAPADQTFTAGGATRTVAMTYEKVKTSRIEHIDSYPAPDNITGEVNGTAIQQIRAKFRRCLAKKTASGEMAIRYLKNDNSNYYDDGTSAKLDGTEGDVMVYFPRFFYKYESIGQYRFAITYSLESIDSTWKESSESLLGAYEAYVTGNKVYSRSGVASTGSVSQDNFKIYSRARGTGYQIIDYDQHKMIAWLFYAIYGDRNCQANCGSGTNSYEKPTGQTNAIGNTDTTRANGNSMSVNFLGIENCWGNKYEWVDNVIVNPVSGNGIWRVTDTVNGRVRDIAGLTPNDQWNWPKTFVAGEFLDIVVKIGGMSDSTGYCDGKYLSTATSRVVLRSCGSSSAVGGVAFAYADYDSSFTNANYGSRLAFRGVIREAESVLAFKALSVTN